MPNSYSFFKPEIKEFFKHKIDKSLKILDVGPGQGTYGKLLADLGYEIDAIEIHGDYVDQFKLWDYYGIIHIGNICDFDYSQYDFIILGDVLEHLSVEDGQKLITDITDSGKECLVAVPYMMEQNGEDYGNIYETHLQADLSPEVIKNRYPQLIELYTNELYGYYMNKRIKAEKAYVLYANEAYLSTLEGCLQSINFFRASDIPVIVYLLNSDKKVEGATFTINWKCNVSDIPYQEEFINRKDTKIYKLLIERPKIVKDALLKFAETVCYVDADSVATRYVNDIFNLYPDKTNYPYFTEGIYDYLHVGGRGGAMSRKDLSTTLEAPACELFNVNQYVRDKYRQTGFFVANHYCFDFLDEWSAMCNHPEVLISPEWYAPFHEETLANVLLYKWGKSEGLPYIYTNAGLERTINILNNKYQWGKVNDSWFKLPNKESELMFIHGTKNKSTMLEILEELKTPRKLKVLFLAPHLSTGGMPAFLLKTIEAIDQDVDISVVEYQFYGVDFIVQREAIKKRVSNFFTLEENKMELFNIIDKIRPDVIHIQEPSERLNIGMIQKLYSEDRNYKIVETCHDVSFSPESKMFHPEAYAFCTPYHIETFKHLSAYKEVIEFPIQKRGKMNQMDIRLYLKMDLHKTHVLNVGLWTPGKNQGEGIEIARKYPEMQFHFVGNQAGNFQDYWEPLMKNLPDNVTIWGERDDVALFMQAADIFMFNSVNECNPLVLREAIGHGLPIVARNLPQYGDMFTAYIQSLSTDFRTIKPNYVIPTYNTLEDFKNKYVKFYENTIKLPIAKQKINITQFFVVNPFIEISGISDSDFRIECYDENNVCHYNHTIKVNCWVKLNREYYTKWRTKIWQDDNLIHDYILNLENKRVFISFDTESLGDTIAWMPYVLKFKEKHNCHIILATYKNFLFEKVYPEIEFIKPGIAVNNIYAQYNVGWKYDLNKEPELCNTIALQKTATNILGLEYEELKPRIDYTSTKRYSGDEYVVIATNSTSGCKFWTKNGWQEVINFLSGRGYKVINVSKEKNPFKNCIQIDDTSMENTMFFIKNAKFFIGLSSGLSWLAWALNKKVIMISNFTLADHEFQECIRITDEDVCHGCWNNANFKFDKGDWDWCPVNKGTLKQFECHKSITGKKVIAGIEKLLSEKKDKLIRTIEGQYWSTVLDRALTNDGDIVDVGCYTWNWSNYFISKKRIIGVDPIENNIPENTELFKGVLGTNNGKVYMDVSADASTIIPDVNLTPVEVLEVDMLSWKTFCKKYNIDKISVLKINIEGSEYALLNSMDEDDFAKIDQITISFHDWMVPKWKDLTAASLSLLRSSGFKILETQSNWGWYLAYKE